MTEKLPKIGVVLPLREGIKSIAPKQYFLTLNFFNFFQ